MEIVAIIMFWWLFTLCYAYLWSCLMLEQSRRNLKWYIYLWHDSISEAFPVLDDEAGNVACGWYEYLYQLPEGYHRRGRTLWG